MARIRSRCNCDLYLLHGHYPALFAMQGKHMLLCLGFYSNRPADGHNEVVVRRSCDQSRRDQGRCVLISAEPAGLHSPRSKCILYDLGVLLIKNQMLLFMRSLEAGTTKAQEIILDAFSYLWGWLASMLLIAKVNLTRYLRNALAYLEE